MLLMGTCRQCGSRSVAGHNRRKVIGRDPICASKHDMGIDLPGSGSLETIGWRRGVVVSGVHRMNEVNARRARLVHGWVTVFGRV